jgi:hypothetical protein
LPNSDQLGSAVLNRCFWSKRRSLKRRIEFVNGIARECKLPFFENSLVPGDLDMDQHWNEHLIAKLHKPMGLQKLTSHLARVVFTVCE